MSSLNDILKLVDDSAMILVVNKNLQISKSLLDYVFNFIYRKYLSSKTKISTKKGLYKRIMIAKNKLIAINFDLDSIQFNGTVVRKFEDLKSIKESTTENNSKMLFKAHTKERIYEYIFDCIITIDEDKVKVTKYQGFYNIIDIEIPIDRLIRNIKLKKLNLFN